MLSGWKARYSRRDRSFVARDSLQVSWSPRTSCNESDAHLLVTRCVKVALPIVLCRDNDNEWLTKCYALATLM